jgi:hypothetical protein
VFYPDLWLGVSAALKKIHLSNPYTTERVTIDSNGYVGIGTSIPNEKLTV